MQDSGKVEADCFTDCEREWFKIELKKSIVLMFSNNVAINYSNIKFKHDY